jgi:hypothetical protein
MFHSNIKADPSLLQLFFEVSQKDMLISARKNSLPPFLSQFDDIVDGNPIVIDEPRTDNK